MTKKTKDGKRKLDTKKLIPIIIASALALIIIFGATLGIIALVREVNSVVSYDGTALTEGVTLYLASSFKQSYLRHLANIGVDYIDSELFWESSDIDGTPYGDKLRAACESYIRKVAVAASLFDRYASISAEQREKLNTGIAEVLDYKADGSVKIFNEMAAPMGFTYSDFVAGCEILFKAENAVAAIYGADGSALATQANISILEEYLGEYAYVKLVFVRHRDRFVLDENGNRIVEDGRDKLESLTAAEREERRADIDEIIASIDSVAVGGDGQMSELYFASLYEKYNDDPKYSSLGYYFSANSELTLGYAEMYGNVVSGALAMDVGDYGYYDVDEDGDDVVDLTVFVHRMAVKSGAYAESAYAEFFEDFYVDAANYHFEKAVDDLAPSVNVKDGYGRINVITLAPNGKFYLAE